MTTTVQAQMGNGIFVRRFTLGTGANGTYRILLASPSNFVITGFSCVLASGSIDVSLQTWTGAAWEDVSLGADDSPTVTTSIVGYTTDDTGDDAADTNYVAADEGLQLTLANNSSATDIVVEVYGRTL